MEHSSLLAAFSISSLRQHFRQPFLATRTFIETTITPNCSTGGYGLNYALPANPTATSTTIITVGHKPVGAVTLTSLSIPPFNHTKITIILLMTWLLGMYFFSYREPKKPAKRPPPSHSWSEYPFRLIHTTELETTHQCSHYCHHAAKLMATTHNTILRGLNAVYAQSFYVRPGTKSAANLLAYCSVVLDFLHHHHSIEERIFFPAISIATSDPNFTNENVAQHRAFESGLAALHLYAATTPPSCFSAHTMRRMIESFAPILTQHLHDEIPSIQSLHDKMPSKTLKAVYSTMVKAAEKESNPFMYVLQSSHPVQSSLTRMTIKRAAPFVFGCQDPSFLLDGQIFKYPEHPLPLPLIKFLVHWVISWRYRALWVFNPSTLYGEPRRTKFCGRS